jgi:pilus assembly protein CpaC
MSRSKRLRTSLATALTAAAAFAPGFALAQMEPPSASAAMRINGGGGPQAASLVLPFGKSAIIDLPTDARDILISNPEIADATVRTSRRAYVVGRQLGQTNIFFFDANGRQIANVEIRVEPDVAPLNEILSRHTNGSSIRAEAVNGSIVLSGSASSASEATRARDIAQRFLANSVQGSSTTDTDRIVNLIAVGGSEQVLLRVRVVEMSRTLVRQLGVNLDYAQMINQLVGEDDFLEIATRMGYSVSGQILGGLEATGGVAENILRPVGVTYPGNALDPNLGPIDAGVAGYEAPTPSNPVETWGPARIEQQTRTQGTIEAFERAGLLRVLAEPNLTAISGEAARFLAGGEFPVPVNSDNGQISVEFKPFGVGLAFTPVVMSGGRISLKVATEVSELTSDGAISTGDITVPNASGQPTVIRGITIPALQVRRAETTVEMPSGGSMVLAGLIQERTRNVYEGVPGVMSSPVLGSLFRSRDFVNNETELVIIITPYLVRPTSPENLRTPADGFRNPSETESFFMGRLNAAYRPNRGAREDHTQSLQGPHGHVIE